MARRKPRRSASASRRGAWGTWRISPPRPISPMTIVSASTAQSLRAPAIANATARSAAGSETRTPPATLAYTSWLARPTPARCCSTATSIDSRFPSKAWATRRGIGAPVGTTSDCTSTHSGRVPSITAATTEPVAPTRRSARNSALGSVTGTSPLAVISMSPSSSRRTGASTRAACASRDAGRLRRRARCPPRAPAPAGRRDHRPS